MTLKNEIKSREVEESTSDIKYVVRRRGGADLTQQKPLFSPDESLLFVISGCNVQIYNVETASFVKSLKYEENSTPIIAMTFLTKDNRTLVTCNKSGRIVTWKWHASVQCSEMDIKIPENSCVQSFTLLSDDEAIVSWYVLKDIELGVVNLKSGEVVRQPSFPELKTGYRWSLDLSYSEENPIVAFSTGSSKLYMFNAANVDKTISYTVGNEGIQTLTWHPTSNVLAIGDTLGRIHLFYNPFSRKLAPKEILHWHHLPLASVVFSPRGGWILSGGSERVLVAWSSKNSKKFVPRLPAPIAHIAASETHYAVSTTDNGIQIIETSTFRVIKCIREAGGLGCVKYEKENDSMRSPNLQYIRPASALLLPSISGHLNLYSIISNSLMYTMDVTNANIVHPEQNNLNPEQIEVTDISVGCRGQWLVTWEGTNEQERIRWWEWSGHDWKLHTVIARPHRPSLPSSLCLASDTPITLSADQNNCMRFWRIIDSVPGYEGKSAWYTNARCSGSGGEPGGATLSSDGSIAASWFGARLTLWDTNDGKQKASLAHPVLRPQGKLIQFGRGHHMHYIACATDTCLAVWNTMTLRLTWIVKLNTACLISDPFSDRVAAITKSNDVFIFKMNDPNPVLVMKNIIPSEQGVITSATFVPCESVVDDFKLYMLKNQQEIFVIERSEVDSNVEQNLEAIGEAAQPVVSAFSAMVAKKTINLIRQKQTKFQGRSSTKALIDELLLSSAAHAQPKLSHSCGSILRALVGARKSTPHEDTPSTEIEDKTESNEVVANPKRVKKKKLLEESLEWTDCLLTDI